MQKHRTRGRSRESIFANANHTLSADCRSSIKSAVSGIVSGTFASDYLKAEYLSKFIGEGSVSPDKRRQAAVERWYSQERVNAETNRRLRGMDRGYNVLPRISFYKFLEKCQHLIAKVLGPLSDDIALGNFSGGASTGRRRTESLPAFKYCGMADVTMEAAPYVDVVHRQSELFRKYNTFYSLREVPGAVLFTVPKKSTIDRCACKEPEINMYLQKGVGSFIRSRLLRFGVNLNDQTINKALARQGSIDDSLATIDLSSASDSVTISCVQALLPHDWYLYLNDIRSSHVVVNGTLVDTEMFSSMGNGFTFELESLIFWALMKTTAYLRGHSGVISVYGDDIIIPSGMYDDATWILSEFGFSPNPDKSFHSGPFRESCGGHYHNGEDVTPFYLRNEPRRLTDLIRVCNQLRRWLLADEGRQYLHPEAVRLWINLRDQVPVNLRGGDDLSVDTQLVDHSTPKHRLVRYAKRRKVPQVGLYLSWQNSNRNRSWEPLDGFPPVRTTHRCRLRRAIPGAVADKGYLRFEI